MNQLAIIAILIAGILILKKVFKPVKVVILLVILLAAIYILQNMGIVS